MTEDVIRLGAPEEEENPGRTIEIKIGDETVRLGINRNLPTHRYVFDIIASGGMYESEALNGARNILQQETLKLVICERNAFGLHQMGHKPSDIEELMTGYGFRDITEEKFEENQVSNWIWEKP